MTMKNLSIKKDICSMYKYKKKSSIICRYIKDLPLKKKFINIIYSHCNC